MHSSVWIRRAGASPCSAPWPAQLLAAFALLGWGTSSASAPERAIWVWEQEANALLTDTAAADDAAAFLRSKSIGTVYLYVDAYREGNLLAARPDRYRRLLRRLHGEGLRVYALLGSANPDTEAYVSRAQRAAVLAMLERVLTYNARSAPEERIDGVNIDIEPHTLAEWREQKEQLLFQFLELGRSFMRIKHRSGQSLPVGPAIPFWFDGLSIYWNGATKPVSEHVIDIYDYVALMDYRNRAEGDDGLIVHARNEVTYASLRNRKLVIGVEVTPNQLRKVSFNHLAEPDLERELALTADAFKDEAAFAGFAIHHLRGYRDWLGAERAEDSP